MQSHLKAGNNESSGKYADLERSSRSNDDRNFLVLRLNSMTPTKSLFALLSNLISCFDVSNPCDYVADFGVFLAGGGRGDEILPYR